MDLLTSLVFIVLICIGLVVWLSILYSRHSRLSSSLAEAEQQNTSLTQDLAEAEQQNTSLTQDLAEAEQQNTSLTQDLAEAEQQNANLTQNLEVVRENNENALRLIHLFEVSLQITAVAYHSEHVRAEGLVKHYKELAEQYEKLHKKFNEAVSVYNEFREEAERRAKRRLAVTGIGALLNLIPGAGLIQIASSLVEGLDSIADAAGGLVDLSGAAETLASSSEAIQDLENLTSFATSVLLLLPEISSDQDSLEEPSTSAQDYQNLLNETFEDNLGPTIEAPDKSAINAFVRNMIERMRDIVESRPESERQDAIAQIVNNFNQYGIRFDNDGGTPKALVAGSSPSP